MTAKQNPHPQPAEAPADECPSGAEGHADGEAGPTAMEDWEYYE